MSTTAVLETYDTQMLDYSGDIDVPMHGSAEPWFQTETPMEDDGQIPNDDDVEVDMERVYEGYTEYEMADEAEVGSHVGESTELVDIDVYDASHAPTPSQVPVDLNSIPPSSVVTDTDVSQQVLTDPMTSLPSSLVDRPFEDPHDEPATDYSHELPKSIPDPSTLIPPHLDFNLTAVGTAENDHHSTESRLSYPDAHPESVVARESVDIVDYHNTIFNSAEDGREGQATTESIHHADNIVHEEDVVSTHVEENAHAVHTHEHVEASNEDNNSGNDTDPHEISEGVYIDPPPAVLLTLSMSSQMEFCLFNHPSSSPNTPSAEDSQRERQTLPLLLHQRPTLYYEPLSNVFEALRQDEQIGRLPDNFEGELVLDAYDLQLVVSEDNIYAREITLHDLNILHDGSDFSGPLRIQLQSIIPRFITRYRLLQDQIARLNIATEAGEEVDEENYQQEYGPEMTHNTNREELEGHHEHELKAEEQGHYVEDRHEPHQYEERKSEDRQEHQPDQHSEPQEHHTADVESTGESLILGTVNLEDEVGQEDAASAQEDEIGHTDTDTGTKQTGDILASEGVYDSVDADAPSGGDYAEYEYTEPPEENDDLYVLPDVVADAEAFVEIEDDDKETVGQEPGLTGEDVQSDQSYQEDFEHHTQAELDHDSSATASGDGAFSETYVVDESVSNLTASLDQEHNASASSSIPHAPENAASSADPEVFDEQEWDDSLDGEGEPDTTWTADDLDRDSNESSVTLSSKTSSKRNHSEFDEDDLDDSAETTRETSPGLKRPRVQ